MSKKKVFGSLKDKEEIVTESSSEEKVQDLGESDARLTLESLEEALPTSDNTVYEHYAFSTYKDEKTGFYYTVKIGFNISDSKVSKPELLEAVMDRYSCNENFKVNVVKYGLLGV